MNKIYTKKGDKGETGTFHGRISKSDQLAITLGTIDELNSWIGVCEPNKEMHRIQTNLMTINSILAGSKKHKFSNYETIHLEKFIDKLSDQLPELKNFIYPVGNLQVARAVCRRAEREIVKLEVKDKNILKYINRLSDALFVMARHVNAKNNVPEEVWKI
ncbi:MAG: cob(I)yrinic acid a,c-diamide adenosyltransferase [Candidatus Amesbacteria bacterium]|nr:cob(I)yrinic acid a,c-diamide adenosyltransferase [Candidatus Amesbacteria bacterium]